MSKPSIKPFLIEYGLISEVSADWKKDFFTGAKGMPKTTEDVINYVENIYITAFGGEQNITVINKKMAKWLVEQIVQLGGTTNIGTSDREKLLIVMNWFKIAGSEGNLPKMDLNAAYEFSKKKIQEKESKEALQKNASQFAEPPITKVEEEGLVERVYTIPDGSGRVWVKVNPNKAGQFFDKLCDANRAYGVGCQSEHSGMMHAQHRKSDRITYTLLGPEKGQKVPISTLMSLSIDKSTQNMVESKQVGNQPIGEKLYGYNDLFDKLVEFLGTSIAKQTIIRTSDHYTLSWAFQNKKFDAINKLDLLRPDFIENSKSTIRNTDGGEEWFATRNLDAMGALKRFGVKSFIENIESYTKSQTFKQALLQLSSDIPRLAGQFPELVLSKINYLLDYLPVENFKEMFKHIKLDRYIIDNKNDFEKLIKKLTTVNSKDAKSYKDIFNNILENYFPAIVQSFGGGLLGLKKVIDFFEMPKSDKHKFVKRTPEGKIIALKKDITVNPETHERTESDTEFELSDGLSILPQKERRDLLKQNESFIKSLVEGSDEKKDINFLRILFGATNPQDVQRTLINDKEKFIKYYDKFNKNESTRLITRIKELSERPDFKNNTSLRDEVKKMVDLAKSLTLDGIPKPGIMSYYAIFNKGKSDAFFKFTIEDLRNPKILSELKEFYEKVESRRSKKSGDNTVITSLNIANDIVNLYKLAGASDEEVYQILQENSDLQNADLIAYTKFFQILDEHTSNSFSKKQIEKSKDIIISKIGEYNYKDLLGKFSAIQYAIEVGDMIEFLGRDVDENDEKYFTLQNGRKYSIMEIDPTEINGIANSKIRVMGGNKKATDWLDIKAFKWEEYGKSILNEESIIRKAIAKKLFETYFKNKK